MKLYLFCLGIVLNLLISSCQIIGHQPPKTSSEQNYAEGDKLLQDFLGITLKTVDGQAVLFHAMASHKASVFVFLSPECPLSQSYSLTLNDFSKKYINDSIYFYGVFPGKLYTIEQMKDFEKDYNIGFPLLLDTAYTLTNILRATITPEAFVIDKTAHVLYCGRIDNWAYEVSKKREHITEHNLQDALDCIVKNTPILISKTKAIGCFIEPPDK